MEPTNSLETFFEQFLMRHDFSDESKVLYANFPWIIFMDIPDAWICLIDDYLRKLKNPKAITEIYQLYGLICFENSKLSARDAKILKSLEEEIYGIDADLHMEIGMDNPELN